jgi:pimeloyl-ACP methyl ester carboxylesterase
MSEREVLGVPAGSPSIDVDGVRLAVARSGKGPPVVCLHAVAHGGGDFAGLAAALAGEFEVIRIDWPGHGRSGGDLQPPTAERYGALLASLIPRLGIAPPILIGNSVGGGAAIHYADRHPVAGLVLCDTAGLIAITPDVRRICRLFERWFAAGERGRFWFKPLYRLYYRFMVLPGRPAREQRERIIAAGPEMAALLRQAWSSFGRDEADIRHVAQRLDVPVWFAWAKGDKVVALARCRPAIASMKDATLTTFAGGHAPFLEDPERFLGGFRDFVRDKLGARLSAAGAELAPSSARGGRR